MSQGVQPKSKLQHTGN